MLGSISSRIARVIDADISPSSAEEPFVEDGFLTPPAAPLSEEVDRVESEFSEEPAWEEERDPMIRVDTGRIVLSSQDDDSLEQGREELLPIGIRQIARRWCPRDHPENEALDVVDDLVVA